MKRARQDRSSSENGAGAGVSSHAAAMSSSQLSLQKAKSLRNSAFDAPESSKPIKSAAIDLYIIHGWTYDVEPWGAVVAELGRLGVVAKLLRVPGLTEPSRKVWTVEEYVVWAEGRIPEGAVALGHSNGGRILLNMLVSAGSERLSGLILLGSAGVYERSLGRIVKRVVAKIFSPLKRVGILRKVFHRLVGAGDYARAPENMKRTLTNMLASDRRLDVSGVTTPMRLIWGAEDATTPLRMGRKLAGELRNARLVVKKGWGHAPYLKNPKGLAVEIARQFKELKGVEK